MVKRVLLALLLVLIPASAWAQPSYPPDVWHPFRGGTNCIQVSDSQGRFNCAAGTTVDPATGNMVVGGTIAFQGLLPGTFVNGLALAPLGTTVQLLGPGDLFISTSGPGIAPSGGLAGGVTLRVRKAANGGCQLVAVGGNGFQEFVIPVLAINGLISQPATGLVFPADALLQSVIPGGPAGC